MSKEYKNIDELFKTELGPSTAKAPAFVKANIDKQLQGKSNKWIFFLIPVVLLSVALPIYFWDNAQGNITASRIIPAELNQSIHSLNQELLTDKTSSSNEMHSNSESQFESHTSQNTTINGNNTNDLIALKNDDLKNVNKNSKNSNKTVVTKNKDKSGKVVNSTKNDLTQLNSDSIQSGNKINITDADHTDLANKTINSSIKDENLKHDFENSTNRHNIDSTENLTTEIDTVSVINDEFVEKEQLDSAKFEGETTLVDSSSTLESSDTVSTAEIIKEDPRKKNWTIDAQVFGGLDFIQSRFTSLNPEAINNFDNNKVKQLSSHFGLAGFVNYRDFSFGTGASIYTLSDEAEYNYYNYSSNPMDSSQTTFYYVPIYDSTNAIIDSTLDSTNTTYNYTVLDSNAVTSQVTNTYKIISIPLSLGYTFNFSSWAVKPRISGILEFSRQTSLGNYPLLGAGNSGLEQLQSLKFGFSLGLEVEVRKYFGQFYALARPGYRIKLTNTAFNANSSIKHNSFNAVLGLGYHFGR